jgi:glycosyltransferase A (GT-A) superfamily protein (DUF2064 family)
VVIVGSDSPSLPADRLRTAVHLLRSGGVDGVIGPSEDGGYYLLGLHVPCPELFVGVAWSTERVLAETLERAARAGRRLAVLAPWYDVDTMADLRRLAAELRVTEAGAPRTRRLLGRPAWRALAG